MAISDIPEYVEVTPGDLIRAENWNGMQQQMRDSLRRHQHTRPPNAPVDDTALSDTAEQIGADELADGAVTESKLADNSVTTNKLGEKVVGTSKIADGAVSTEKISPNAINASRLSFSILARGSESLTPGQTKDIVVATIAPNQKSGIYFPVLTLAATNTPGTSIVEAKIVHSRGNADTQFFVNLRLINLGNATAGIIWQVLTFAS
jgi:hypothetical protein